MKKLKNKLKKFNKTKAKRKLDTLFSLKIRNNRAECQAGLKVNGIKCGGPLQTAHIENRANIRLRWDVMNVLCLCFGHHFWFHRNPTRFVEFLTENYPREYQYIQDHRNEKQTFDKELYEKLMIEFT